MKRGSSSSAASAAMQNSFAKYILQTDSVIAEGRVSLVMAESAPGGLAGRHARPLTSAERTAFYRALTSPIRRRILSYLGY